MRGIDVEEPLLQRTANVSVPKRLCCSAKHQVGAGAALLAGGMEAKGAKALGRQIRMNAEWAHLDAELRIFEAVRRSGLRGGRGPNTADRQT